MYDKYDPTQDICVNCRHYYRHFIYNEDLKQYRPTLWGHCVYPRSKPRKETDCCRYFERRECDAED